MINSTDTIKLYGKTYTVEQIVLESKDYIRLEAVDLGFALEQLATVSSPLIKSAVARKKAGHELLAYDLNWRIRSAVAQHCTDPFIIAHLAQDENDFVRFLIAKRGLAAEYLSNDSDQEIASLAKQQLEQHRQAA